MTVAEWKEGQIHVQEVGQELPVSAKQTGHCVKLARVGAPSALSTRSRSHAAAGVQVDPRRIRQELGQRGQ